MERPNFYNWHVVFKKNLSGVIYLMHNGTIVIRKMWNELDQTPESSWVSKLGFMRLHNLFFKPLLSDQELNPVSDRPKGLLQSTFYARF